MKAACFILLILYACTAAAEPTPLFVDDPEQLQRLEASGFDLAHLAFGSARQLANNQLLYQAEPGYRAMVHSLRADLDALSQTDRSLSTTMHSPHRLFHAAWLRSTSAFYELVGVVHRLDRAPFSANFCGEIRFIYRLAYRQPQPAVIYSRLPMTVNVVHWATSHTGCAASAQQWEAFLQALAQRAPALSPALLGVSATSFKSLEVNLQSVRWPATVRPDMAGYAEYFLRVFRRQGQHFVPAVLENTPDVDKILAQPALQRQLRAWLRTPEVLQAIDSGVVQLPPEFLATKATSVALHGVHRLANAPFTRLFSEEHFGDLRFEGMHVVKSPHGLLRRLNDLTCVGCHQGRTVAGFHFLGQDRPHTDAVNAIAVAASPHFFLDQPRRQRFFQAVQAGQTPVTMRPLSVRAEHETGEVGAHCGLADPTFTAWRCRAGLTCTALLKDEGVSRTGVCASTAMPSGSSCQPGRMQHHMDPHRDRVVLGAATSCRPGQHCEDSSVGFPGGMCSGGCAQLLQGETCGSIAILQGFNRCLARGQEPFATCLGENVRPAVLQACAAAQPCRDDYICARTLAGSGACIPPYFLFQLRVDGHPTPAVQGPWQTEPLPSSPIRP